MSLLLVNNGNCLLITLENIYWTPTLHQVQRWYEECRDQGWLYVKFIMYDSHGQVGSKTKSSLKPVFIDNVLLEYTIYMCLGIDYGCSCTTKFKLIHCEREVDTTKNMYDKNFSIWDFYEGHSMYPRLASNTQSSYLSLLCTTMSSMICHFLL
jgi:hypothetical protein